MQKIWVGQENAAFAWAWIVIRMEEAKLWEAAINRHPRARLRLLSPIVAFHGEVGIGLGDLVDQVMMPRNEAAYGEGQLAVINGNEHKVRRARTRLTRSLGAQQDPVPRPSLITGKRISPRVLRYKKRQLKNQLPN
jgi:hypothetical protein